MGSKWDVMGSNVVDGCYGIPWEVVAVDVDVIGPLDTTPLFMRKERLTPTLKVGSPVATPSSGIAVTASDIQMDASIDPLFPGLNI